MEMQRAALRLFLAAGPARKLDVRVLRSKVPPAQRASAQLFDSPRLNDSVLFKGVPMGSGAGEASDTDDASSIVVFLPFDPERPGNGGGSFVFSEAPDGEALCRRWLKQEKAEGSDLDIAKLKVLNSTPTFSAAILDLAFQRADIAVPDCYACIRADLRAKLEEHLKARLRSMVVAAVGGSAASVEHAVEFFVAKLLAPDPSARVAVTPLVQALQLPPKEGWDVLAAWIGLAIYECETVVLQSRIREFVAWLGEARPSERLRNDDKEMVASMMRTIHQRTRDAWNDLIVISRASRESHEAMALNGNIRTFVEFLKNAPQYVPRVGDVIGRLEQSVFIWKQYLGRYRGEPLPYREFYELCDILRHILVASDVTYGINVSELAATG